MAEDPDRRQDGAAAGHGWRQALRLPPVLVVLILATCLPELALHLSGDGLTTRIALYQDFAFWPGLLGSWRPNYPWQGAVMFLSYGFLHTGLLHLVVNMLTLGSLGKPLIARVGNLPFLVLYLFGLFGGAIGYALLSARPQPMVGASGALFGLAGALVCQYFLEDLREEGWEAALRGLLRPVLVLAALNMVMFLAMDGRLAWQTHLGGFLAGALVMLGLERDRPDEDTGEDPGDDPGPDDAPGEAGPGARADR